MSLVDGPHPMQSPRNTSPPYKRSHDESFGPHSVEHPHECGLTQKLQHNIQNGPHNPESNNKPPIELSITMTEPKPGVSTTSTLSELGSVRHSSRQTSPSVETTALVDPDADVALSLSVLSSLPSAKRKKITFEEREEKRLLKEARDAEKVREKARKDAEKEDKRRRIVEEKLRREEEKQKVDGEKAKKDAEKEERRQRVVEEKQRREEEKMKREEEKKKKLRSQKTLSCFFDVPKAKDEAFAGPAAAEGKQQVEEHITPSKVKKDISTYEKMFPPFFVRADVTMAPVLRFERDEEAAETAQYAIDRYTCGTQSPGRVRSFDAASLFYLRPSNSRARGKRIVSVRGIMAEAEGNATRPIDLTTESQNVQIRRRSNLLGSVQMKYIYFDSDVRPAYRGTYTSSPRYGLRKLGRSPFRKDNMNTDYDYDSEAEWVEDEDAEDCNSDGDEEDELDDGDDMNEFLDDEGDELANPRKTLMQGDLIPVSTGLCWEDGRKKSTKVKMMAYRMEIILDPTLRCIDPFSTQYWQPTTLSIEGSAVGMMEPPPSRTPLHTIKSTNANAPIQQILSPASANVTLLTQQASSSTSSKMLKDKDAPAQFLSPAHFLAFKQAIQGSNLSKIGLIEVLKKQFPGTKSGVIKGTLELVARREGKRESEKRWVLVEE